MKSTWNAPRVLDIHRPVLVLKLSDIFGTRFWLIQTILLTSLTSIFGSGLESWWGPRHRLLRIRGWGLGDRKTDPSGWPIGLTHRADPSNRGMGGSVWDSATFVPNPSKSNLSTSQIGVHRVQVDFGATILQFKCLFLLVFWFFGDFNLLFQHGAYRKYSSHMNAQDCQI